MPIITPRIKTTQEEARDLLRQALQRTGLSARAFSHVLSVDERTVRRWIAADRPMPGPVIQLCRLLIANPELVARLVRRPDTEVHATTYADAGVQEMTS